MTDLMSRSEVLNMIERTKAASMTGEVKFTKSQQNAIRTIADLFSSVIKDTPAVDAVPVVRCKDCFYRGLSDCPIPLAPDEGFCHIGSLTGD